MSTPPNAATTCAKARCTEAASVTSQASASAAPPIGLGFLLRGFRVDIEQRDLGAGLREGARGRGADGAAGAGDDRDLAGERQLLPRCRAWPAPAANIRSRTCRLREIDVKRPIASASVMPCDRGLGDVGGDRCVLGAGAQAEQAEAGHQHDARQRIVHRRAAGARVVAREIGLVVVDEFLRGRLRAPRLNSSSLPASGAGTISGQGLVRMTWSGVMHAGAGVARELLAVDEIEDRVAGAEFEDRPPVRAFAVGIAQRCRRRAGSARPSAADAIGCGQRGGGETTLRLFCSRVFGERDHLDHALVGLARARRRR